MEAERKQSCKKYRYGIFRSSDDCLYHIETDGVYKMAVGMGSFADLDFGCSGNRDYSDRIIDSCGYGLDKKKKMKI